MEFIAQIGIAFEHGRFWMWPIAVFQVLSLAIIFERLIALFVSRRPTQIHLIAQFEDNIRRGELDTVITKAMALKAVHPIAKALVAGTQAVQRFGGKDEIQGKMDEVLLHENALLDRRVGYLSMLGNVATLTGLLGTITGMIRSFAAVAYANPSEKAALLAEGISEAMNCTAYGLIVAIPALVMYAVLQGRAGTLAEDLNQAALKVFNWLSYSYEPIGKRRSAVSSKSSDLNSGEFELNA
jgi:biopolymer transport protein ExbB/TolQ